MTQSDTAQSVISVLWQPVAIRVGLFILACLLLRWAFWLAMRLEEKTPKQLDLFRDKPDRHLQIVSRKQD